MNNSFREGSLKYEELHDKTNNDIGVTDHMIYYEFIIVILFIYLPTIY